MKFLLMFFLVLFLGCSSTQESQSDEDNFSVGNENYSADGNSDEANGAFQYNDDASDYGENFGDGEQVNSNYNEFEDDSGNLLTGDVVDDSALFADEGATELINEGANLFADEAIPADTPENLPAPADTGEEVTEEASPAVVTEPVASEQEQTIAQSKPAAAPVVVPTVPDVQPVAASVWWVGYDYNRTKKLLKVQILTKGRPQYDVFQEKNRAGQPELTVRFYGTDVRQKVSRDIDASEFSSPVAFVRMRVDESVNIVDVVLTLREEIRPLMFAKKGNVQLTFPLSEKYLGKNQVIDAESYKAELLGDLNIMPEIVTGSEEPKSSKLAKVYIPEPGREVFSDPKTGSQNVIVPDEPEDVVPVIDREGLPVNDFDTENVINIDGDSQPKADESSQGEAPTNEKTSSPTKKDSEDSASYQVESFSMFGVAQDNFGYEANAAGDSGSAGAENTGDLQFGDYDEGGDLNLSGDGSNTVDQVEAETLTVDDIAESNQGIKADILGADSEFISDGFSGKPVYLEFYNAPLGQVLKAFGEQIGVNFIYPPDLDTSVQVTIKLKDVPWDAALNAMLETYQLGMARINDNIIRVDRIARMNEYISAQEQARNIKILSQPPKVLLVRLSNASAADILGSITVFISGLTSAARGAIKLSSDVRTNSIFVEAPPGVLSRIKALVERLDVPVPQVEILSRLIEVSRSTQNFMGISWAGAFNYDANRGLGFGTLNFPNHFGSTYSVDPGVNSVATTGTADFSLGSINNVIDLNLRLKMEETKGTAEVLQSSRVLVNDRQQAQITAGQTLHMRPQARPAGEQVVDQSGAGGPTTTSSGTTGVSINFNLTLDVTPQVTNDGKVELAINLSSSSPQPASVPGVTIGSNNRSLRTTLKKRSGETAVIGGIYDTRKTVSEVGIPFFSSLPIIGALFRSKNVNQIQTEMMMLITPRIKADTGDTIAEADSAPVPVYEGNNSQFNLGNEGNYENAGNGAAANGNYGNGYSNEGANALETLETYNNNGAVGLNNYNQNGGNDQYENANGENYNSNNYGNY